MEIAITIRICVMIVRSVFPVTSDSPRSLLPSDGSCFTHAMAMRWLTLSPPVLRTRLWNSGPKRWAHIGEHTRARQCIILVLAGRDSFAVRAGRTSLPSTTPRCQSTRHRVYARRCAVMCWCYVNTCLLHGTQFGVHPAENSRPDTGIENKDHINVNTCLLHGTQFGVRPAENSRPDTGIEKKDHIMTGVCVCVCV